MRRPFPPLRDSPGIALARSRPQIAVFDNPRGPADIIAFDTTGGSDKTGTTVMELKLIALDRDDLAVVSTHVQDAVVKVADIHWRPAEKRLVMAFNRFDWEEAQVGPPQDGGAHFRRRRTALRFERVVSCQCRHVTPHDKDAVLNLLAVEFTEGDAPAGTITLTFSGDVALRLTVECLEAELADLGPVWETPLRPVHPDDAGQATA